MATLGTAWPAVPEPRGLRRRERVQRQDRRGPRADVADGLAREARGDLGALRHERVLGRGVAPRERFELLLLRLGPGRGAREASHGRLPTRLEPSQEASVFLLPLELAARAALGPAQLRRRFDVRRET